jgi:hypothetical protein
MATQIKQVRGYTVFGVKGDKLMAWGIDPKDKEKPDPYVYGVTFATPPVVVMSYYAQERDGGASGQGDRPAITHIDATKFTVRSGNYADDLGISWIAVGEPVTQQAGELKAASSPRRKQRGRARSR